MSATTTDETQSTLPTVTDETPQFPSWRYRGGVWTELALDAPGIEGFEEHPAFSVGEDLVFEFSVFYRKTDAAPGDFLVVFMDSTYGHEIVCDRLPDMLRLVRELTPITEAVERSSDREHLFTHRRDHLDRASGSCDFCIDREERRRLGR